MLTLEMIAYLKTWAKLNSQEVYGSSKSFIHIDTLMSELNKLEEIDR